MGTAIVNRIFRKADYHAFYNVLRDETNLLKKWVKEKNMSERTKEVGLELEGWLLDENMSPSQSNLQFIRDYKDYHLVFEITKSCLEINSDRYPLDSHVFSRHEASLNEYIGKCIANAGEQHKNFIYVGALPTAQTTSFSKKFLTKAARYHAIDKSMVNLRDGNPICFDIQGEQDRFIKRIHSVAIGGAIAALQIHLRIGLSESARCYNTAQIIAAPLVALCCNSPCLLGQRLWSESRIPFLEQLFQMKNKYNNQWTTRAFFGRGYLKQSMLELFIENETFHESLLPEINSASREQMLNLRLHNGTIYRWNRPVLGFDESGGPHFRIENRMLSSGPTVVDMCANMAFYIGLIQFFSNRAVPLESEVAFKTARRNFYLAARHGLAAKLNWVDNKTCNAGELLLNTLLPAAWQGLTQLDINQSEIGFYLSILEARVRTLRTGSYWQNLFLEKNNNDVVHLTQTYVELQKKGFPVHEWPI
ncbi:hypothetical protein [Legionella spiritensis]|uniref:Carboxylate-amine ligase YbdK n=1 Tax=Legionella spiritensis TaxID=452 RepID=A0A0W0YXU6_LEGSP|nr:hypothetical protein [Legionella spiritensis]KTD61700.1 Carboxylate-amine ligase YbdK [Legionella spiritensis]SNV38874.1 Uncharacterised protein [Legionella spiritensis]